MIGSGLVYNATIQLLASGAYKLSPLCGFSWCFNMRHICVEPIVDLMERASCHRGAQECNRQPPCVADHFAERDNMAYVLESTIFLRRTFNSATIEANVATACPDFPASFKVLHESIIHVFDQHRHDASEVEKDDALFCTCGNTNKATSCFDIIKGLFLEHRRDKCSSAFDTSKVQSYEAGDFLWSGTLACLMFPDVGALDLD